MSTGGIEPPSTGPKPVILSVKLCAQIIKKALLKKFWVRNFFGNSIRIKGGSQMKSEFKEGI